MADHRYPHDDTSGPVRRWRPAIERRAPGLLAALSRSRAEELCDMLEDAWHEARIEVRGEHPDLATAELDRRARILTWRRLGSLDELARRLGADPARTRPSTRGAVAPPLLRWLEATIHELRAASRSLRRSPGFTLASVVVLSLGLASTLTLFTLFHSVVLTDLPYPEADRLGIVRVDALGREGLPFVSDSNVLDFREGAEAIADLQGAGFPKLSLGRGSDMRLVRVASVDAGLPDMLGVRPVLGRTFAESLDAPEEGFGNVLLSHELWRREFDADPDVVGRTMVLSEREVQVVGVLPAGQRLELRPHQPEDIELWTVRSPVRDRGTVLRRTAFVRLAEGATYEQASAELQAIADRGRVIDHDESSERIRYQVTPLLDSLVEDSRPSLSMLLLATLSVLLLACINVAALLVARGLTRREEWAMRAALGAGRLRLLWAGLAEGVLLASLAGLVGTLLAVFSLRAVATSQLVDLPRLDDLAIRPTILLFALAATFATALLAGLLPAWGTARGALRGPGGRSVGGRLPGAAALVVAQVALALLLLAGAGVLLRTFLHLQRVDLGFEPRGLLTFDFSLPREAATDGATRMRLNLQLLDRLEELDEVEHASVSNVLPLGGGMNLATYSFDGTEAPLGEHTASFHRVLPDYFATLGIDLLEGRDFEDRDSATPNAAVIVSRSLAEAAWPGEDALDHRLQIDFATPDGGTELRAARIIGVVDDVRESSLHSRELPQAYLAYGESSWAQDFVVRTSVPPQTLRPRIEGLLDELGTGLVLDDFEIFDERVRGASARQRLALLLAGSFSFIALVIATLGVYASMAQRVQRRSREIGLRMALGAGRSDVVRWILRRGVTLAAVGTAVGLALSLALLGLLERFLFRVSAQDPLTLASVAVLVLVCAGLASWGPALRATRIDPRQTLAAD